VAIIIKRDIAHKTIKNNGQSSVETLIIKLANNAAYNRPDNKFSRLELRQLFEHKGMVIVGGDFNAKQKH
jgi:endonuclease/exonuclease/phosphatase (EEP) superfamily protein YafD